MPELTHIGYWNVSEISMHIRHCILYEFQLGNTASATAGRICAALDEDAIVNRTCRDCFKRFRETTRHRKIVRGPDILYNLMLNE